MKKICTLAFAVLFGMNAMAQQKSNVVVFSEDGESFFAFLNGIKQNATAQSNVKITDIPGEGASLRLVFANSSDQPLKQDMYFMEPNQEHTIKVKRDKKGVLKMRYFGAVPLAQSTTTAATVPYTVTEPVASTPVYTDASTTNGTVNSTNTYNTSTSTTGTGENGSVNMNMQVNDPNMNGTTTTSQTVSTTTTTNGTATNGTTGNGNVNMNVGVGDAGFNMNVSVSGNGNPTTGSVGNENVNMNVGMSGMDPSTSSGTSSSTTTTTTTTTTSSSSSVNGYTTGSSSTTTTNGGYNTTGNTTYDNNTYATTASTGGSCGFAMDETSFGKMKNTISSNSFDDTKMSTAKTATKGSCLSTDQVKEIMMLFSFDDDRLAYARFAYDYTVDKNNYYTLGQSFSFDGSKEELNKFIETKR